MDWVRLSSAIERNRTPHFQWVRFPNKSNSIEQIELNRTQSVWLCSIEFGNRTQSNTIKWISFDWLWWTYTKQAQSKPVKASFSYAFFTVYSITHIYIYLRIPYKQFSYLGNRARYEFIELDMSTGLDMSIPSSRPLTFPGGQSKNGYRARWLIKLGDLSSSVFQEKRKREKMKVKAIMTYHSWYFKIVSNFTRLAVREITYNSFEISLVVLMPNITTNPAITYTNFHFFSFFLLLKNRAR